MYQERKKPNMSIKIPDISMTPIKTNTATPGSLDNLSEDVSSRHLHFALADSDGVSVLQQGSDEDISGAPSISSYQPSWTPKDMGKSIEGHSPWAHTSNLLSSPITTPLDRSKLKSIKKGGRKPGSRMRARTADEALLQDDLMATELPIMPATAGNDNTGRCLSGVDNSRTRSDRFEEQQLQQQIQKIKVSGRRGSRSSSISFPADLPIAEKEYFSAKGFKKMETLEFSSDSDTEQSGSSKSKRKLRGVAAHKPVGEDPFGTKGGSLVHSDDEKEECTSASQKPPGRRSLTEGEEEVKTFPARRKNQPCRSRDKEASLEEESFSVQGSSFQRQNSTGSQSIENETQTQTHTGHQASSSGGSNSNSGRTGRGGLTSSLNRHTGSSAKMANSGGNKNNNSNGSEKSNTSSTNGNEHISIVVNQGEQPSGQEVFDYLERGQLEPCAKPSKDINKAIKELTTAEWPDIFYLLNTTRRLMIHHSAEISKSGQLHAIALGLIKQVRQGILVESGVYTTILVVSLCCV